MSTTPSKEQQKRSAADIFAAFEYQWDYFVLMLLKENDDTVSVRFEVCDDVDAQSGENVVLYQIKHSVQKNARGTTINLSNRDTDLWKTISIWTKLIDENPATLDNSNYFLVTNKNVSLNKFGIAIEAYKKNHNEQNLKSTLIEIGKSNKSEVSRTDSEKKSKISVSEIITSLLNKSYWKEFCLKISLIQTADSLKEDIKRIMSNRFGLRRNRVEWVYNHIMTSIKDDSIEDIIQGKPISYTGAIFTEKYQNILDIGRQKIYFRSDYSYNDFKGNPMELLFMKQLFSIGDTKETELERIVELTTRWLRFKNNLHEHWDNNDIIEEDVAKLTLEVCSAWGNCYRSKHHKISSTSTEEELCDAGCNTVYEMRNKKFSISDTPLDYDVSEGCLYYYSNSPTEIIPNLPLIGWHRDWKSKFKEP